MTAPDPEQSTFACQSIGEAYAAVMALKNAAVSVLLVVAAMRPTTAHHSARVVYEDRGTITIEGVLRDFKFINPHALMSIDVTDASGKTVSWTVECHGRLALTETGWTERSVQPGEHVRITGRPGRDGIPRIFLQRLVRPNGVILVAPGDAQIDAVEELRRRRIQERNR
jgi:hypothetical protein